LGHLSNSEFGDVLSAFINLESARLNVVHEDFARLLRRLDRPKSGPDLHRTVDALELIAAEIFNDAIEVLRDPAWDRPVDLGGRWGRGPLKQQLWTVLLTVASPSDIERMWFLADQPDTHMRKNFIADALSKGHSEQLVHARSLLNDPQKEVREYTAIGLWNALKSASDGYQRAVAAVLFDYVRAYPKDYDGARMTALRACDSQMADEAQRILDEAHRLDLNADWFVVRAGDLGWGDYGHVLVHGIAWNLEREADGIAQLERTGPFVPPFTMPSDWVAAVTADARVELDASGLLGLSYRPIALTRIVKYPWHEWDLDAKDPAKYPSAGEPENYVLKRKHSPELASAMQIIELVVDQIEPAESLPDDRDLIRRGSRLLASARAREWMAQRWDRWIFFKNLDE
jgi:hypothetical protein